MEDVRSLRPADLLCDRTLTDHARYSSQSTALNKSRLEVLRSRAEHLDSIFDETKIKVKELSKNSDKYQSVLEGLILEVGIH